MRSSLVAQTFRIAAAVGSSIAAMVPVAHAAQTYTETFPADTAGWETRSSLGTGFWDWDFDTTSMFLQFAPIAFPFPDSAFMTASNLASSGKFVGNWATSGVGVIGFDFYPSNTLPSSLELRLSSAGGSIVAIKGLASAPVGERVRVAVPTATAAAGGWGGITEADFAKLLTNVQEVAISVKRASLNDEYYYVDNVFLDRVYQWDGGGSGTGTLWLSATNWFADGNPGSNSIVVFAATGAAAVVGLDMAAATGSVVHLGQLNVTVSNRTFENASATSNGTINLYALGGVLMSNDATTVTFRDGASRSLRLRLLANGDLYTAGSVYITNSVITETGGTRRITKTGPGTLYLGATNTFSGGLVVNGGVVDLLSGTNAMGFANVQPNFGGTVADGQPLNQTFLARIARASSGTVALAVDSSSNLDFSASGASLTNAGLGAFGTATFSGGLTPFTNAYRLGGGGGTLIVTTVLASNRSLIAFGGGSGGTLQLTASNSYSGGTRILGGTVLVSNEYQLGSAAITNAGGLLALGNGFIGTRSLVLAGTNACLDVPSGTGTWSGPISGSGQIRPALSGGTLVLAGSATNAQPFVLERGNLVFSNATIESSSWQLGRATSATFAVTFAATSTATVGTGGVQLCTSPNGGTNAASGTLTVSGGSLTAPLFDLNVAGTASSTGLVVLSGGVLQAGLLTRTGPGTGELRLDGGTLRAATSTASLVSGLTAVHALAGGARVDTGTNTVQFGQTILAGTPSGGLVKSGTGRLTLAATNSFTGPTVVSNGTLAVSGTGSLGSSSQLVIRTGAHLDVTGAGTNFAVGSTQTLSGDGTVSGAVTVAGTVSPGVGIGTLTLESNCVFGAAGRLYVESDSTSSVDRLVVAGIVTLGGNLTLTNIAYAPAAGNTFTVLTAAAISGAFATTNLPVLSTGLQWNVSTAGGRLVLRCDATPLVQLNIADSSAPEGNSGTSAMTFVVTLSATSALPVHVSYFTANGGAAGPGDYVATTGSLTFAAGVTSMTFQIQLNGDTDFENDETFLIQLFGATNASIADGFAVGTILNDDAPPLLTIGNPTAFEGDSGTNYFVFPLSLSAVPPLIVQVSYEVVDGTADIGDYQPMTAVVEIPAGSATGQIVVGVFGDTTPEDNEYFFVHLFAPSNATLVATQAVGTILNDDNVPTLSVGDVSAGEGQTGTSNFAFRINLTATSAVPVTVQYSTAGGTATPGTDFSSASGAATVPAGQTSVLVQISVNGDSTYEADETFFFNLATPTNALPGDMQAVGTILNDDTAPTIAIGDATVTEGDGGTTGAVFVVTLSAAAGLPVTVDYATADDTATAGLDFTGAAGTLLIPAGVTSTSITIAVTGDTNAEPTETYFVDLSSPSNATLADAQAIGTILPDDGLPVVSVSDVTATEGSSGTSNFNFAVVLSAPAAFDITVNYATTAGTASNGADFASVTGLLTLATGQRTGLVAVAVVGDTLHEADETFTFHLSTPTNALLGGATGLGTILDDDAVPALSLTNATRTEGNSGSTTTIVLAVLSAPSALPASFDVFTSNGTATAGIDYTAMTGTVTFAAFATNAQMAVVVHGDTLFEADETVLLRALNGSGLSLATTQATITLVNDDLAPVLTVATAAVTEGNSGTTDLVFEVSLDAPSGLPVSVPYAVTGATATAGADFVAATGMIDIAAGATSTSVTVTVLGDGTFEGDETLVLSLGSATNVTLATNRVLGTIVDDDVLGTLDVADASVLEGQSGTTNLRFVVTVTPAIGTDLTVHYATASGTASNGTDFTGTSGTLLIPAGASSGLVNIAVSGDTLFELDETLTLTLSNPTNAVLGDATATGTILNDDTAPALSLSDASAVEGSGGPTPITLTVSIPSPSALPVTAGYFTSNGTALAGVDYTAVSGTIEIPAGSTSATLVVHATGDTLAESDETLTVVLENPVNATIADVSGTVTILDDDPLPGISIASASVSEGNVGTTSVTFAVHLERPFGGSATVDFATADGTATAGTDYTAVTGVLTFAEGVTNGSITVGVAGDVLHEGNETFLVNLSAPAHATLSVSQATGTILDDDTAPSFAVTGASVAEGASGTTSVVFTVTLTPASAVDSTVDFATADGSATGGLDYAASTGTLLFVAGETSATVSVSVQGDTLFEYDETLHLNLSGAANATIGVAQATATILNDDDPPGLSLQHASIPEGNAGTTNLLLYATLSAPAGVPVAVSYATANGSATGGTDFVTSTGRLTFAAGVSTTSITIAINGDTLNEIDEDFTVTLSAPSNAVLDAETAVATILNDDPLPVLSVQNASVTEGNSGTTSLVFRIALSPASGRDVSIDYTTVDGTATHGLDYGAAAGALTLPAGATSATVSVAVQGDTAYEGDETFLFAITNAVAASLVTGVATGTIVNDDTAPLLAISGFLGTEGNSGATNFSFAVTLSQAAALPVSVNFTTSNGTATAGSDFTATAGTLVLQPGTVSTQIPVQVFGDTMYEQNETFTVVLSSPTNAAIGTGSASATIINDDTVPTLSIEDLAAAEGQSGTSNFLVRVGLSHASAFAVTARCTAVAGTAVAGGDFAATSGVVVVSPGSTNAAFLVAVAGNTIYESNETFEVRVTNAVNATLLDTQAVVTILNDDPLPALTISDASVGEGDAGDSTLSFRVFAPNASAYTVTVDFATADGTASNDSDYVASAGTLVLAPGSTSATIAVTVHGDTVLETTELLTVTLTNPVQAVLVDPVAVGAIVNDDPMPVVTLEADSVNEGDAGTTSIVFVATLSFPSPFDASVNFATANNGATAGSDYVASSGTLFVAAGEQTGTVVVTVYGDTMYEGNENIRLNLSSPTNVGLGQSFATATIFNDDAFPTAYAVDMAANEGNAGTNEFAVTIQLSNPTMYPVYVDYAVTGDSATEYSDFLPVSGTLYFPPGTDALGIQVGVLGDTLEESNETFHVEILGVVNALIGAPFAYGTILNDDYPGGYAFFAAQITNAAERGEQMDPDGDGYPNLLEYVTGGDPNTPDTKARIDALRLGGSFVLHFGRATNATDAVVIVEGSRSAADDGTWSGIATNIAGSWGGVTNVLESGTGTPVSVSVTDTDAAATNRFLRLRAVRP